MLKIYKILSHLATPFIWALVHFRKYKGFEDPIRYQERLGISTHKFANTSKPVIWFHAASVGESMSIMPVIQNIKDTHPEWNVLITTITVTSSKLWERHTSDSVMHHYVPFDIPGWVERFLKTQNPDILILMESELWPNLLRITKSHNIPIYLMNARLSDKSFTRWFKIPDIIKQLLSNITHIYAQSPKVLDHFRSLNIENVSLMTNLKYASPPLKYNEKDLEHMVEMVGSRPIFLSVSTHKCEEDIIIETHDGLLEHIPNLLTIIVPRHPKRSEAIVKLFENRPHAVRSMSQPINNDTQIYLADTIGELGLFFEMAPFVCMGGSFLKHIDGHNPIEPSLFGVATIVGPHMGNFSDIMDDLKTAIIEVQDQNTLQTTVLSFLKDPKVPEKIGEAAQSIVESKTSVVNDMVNTIEDTLQKISM